MASFYIGSCEVKTRLRLIKIYVLDTDERLTPEEACLFSSSEYFTRDNDNTLRIKFNINLINLDEHNLTRQSKNLPPVEVKDLDFRIIDFI